MFVCQNEKTDERLSAMVVGFDDSGGSEVAVVGSVAGWLTGHLRTPNRDSSQFVTPLTYD